MTVLLLACAGPSLPHSGKDTVAPDDSVPTDSTESGDASNQETGDSTDGDTVAPDTDADGYKLGDDCDDANPAIHPWAREVPYDGIDQDCDGADLVDADADGHLPLSLGGDDCDDFAAGTHPGALEYCDPADEDCDGDPLPDGVCAGLQDGTQMLVQAFGAAQYAHSLSWAGDLDGDGTEDLLVGCGLHTCDAADDGGGYFFVAGGRPTRPPAQSWRSALGHWWQDDGATCSYLQEAADGIGDVDGDGHDDAMLHVGGCSYGLYLDGGPLADDGAVTLIGRLSGVWRSPYAEYDWGIHRVGAQDLDGDGSDDTVATFDGEAGEGLTVYFGTSIDGTADSQQLSAPPGQVYPSPLGDIDGDGLDEFAVSDNRLTAWIISGGDLRGADGASIETVALGELVLDRSVNPDPSLISPAIARADDLNGDGVSDWVASGSYSEAGCEKCGEVWVFSGSQRGTFSQTAAVGSWTGPSERSYFSYNLKSLDFDGDGRTDLLASALGVGGWYLIPGASGMPAPATPVEDVPHVLVGGSDYYWLAARLGADFTGDGFDDVVMVTADDSTVGFLPGWPVPWDDPRYL